MAGVGSGGVGAQLGQINSTAAYTGHSEPDEFDMFAQARQTFDASRDVRFVS